MGSDGLVGFVGCLAVLMDPVASSFVANSPAIVAQMLPFLLGAFVECVAPFFFCLWGPGKYLHCPSVCGFSGFSANSAAASRGLCPFSPDCVCRGAHGRSYLLEGKRETEIKFSLRMAQIQIQLLGQVGQSLNIITNYSYISSGTGTRTAAGSAVGLMKPLITRADPPNLHQTTEPPNHRERATCRGH